MGYFSKLSERTAGQPIPAAKETTAPAALSDVRGSVPADPDGTVPTAQEPQIKAVPIPVPNAPSEPTAAPEGSQEGETAVAPIPLDVPADDAAARQAHDAAEAKRKAEWDARQAQKKAAEQAALDELAAMSDADAISEAAKRVSDTVEKITRRSMKEQVSDHLQALCRRDPAFARKTMHPRKSMAHCFRYISRKAYEYIQDGLEADGIEPGPGSEGYGCDVPDDLVYEWAENYYNDPNAEEDKKNEEKFVPKPYVSAAPAPRKKTQGKADKKPPKPKDAADAGQITLGGFAAREEKAG